MAGCCGAYVRVGVVCQSREDVRWGVRVAGDALSYRGDGIGGKNVQ